MDRQKLTLLQAWFTGFAGSFHALDGEEQRNITLKEEHTGKVCANIARLAAEGHLDEGGVTLAEAVALFHDLGRFPQYRRYKTFNDSMSVNHAQLGVRMLADGGILDKLPRNEQDIIITGVRFHNCLTIPAGLDPEPALYLKLVRDADKLDIWRVFLEYYRLPEKERASAVSLGFPDRPEWSQQILTAVNRREIARLAEVKSLTDFKLLQLSWVYDLNFPSAFQMLLERDFINGLAMTLPDHEDIQRAITAVREFALHGSKRGTV